MERMKIHRPRHAPPGWGECMRCASHALRVPGWIIAAVFFSHLACCTGVWRPWAADLSRRGLITRGPPPPEPAHDPAPGDAAGGAGALGWRDIVAMDPMSIAAYALGLSEDEAAGAAGIPPRRSPRSPPPPPTNEPGPHEGSCPGGGGGGGGGGAEPTARDAACILAIPAASFLALWLPSSWNGAPGGLRCLVATLGCLTGALGACTAAMVGLPVRGAARAGACAAMHLAAQSIGTTWYVLASCPGRCPPLEGCGNGIAQGVCSASMALLFFYISHHHESDPIGSYGALELYASHAWGVALAEAVRALVNAPVLWLAGV